MSDPKVVLSREEEFFRRQEAELVEKMRLRNQAESERREMAAALGVSSDAILADLLALGFNRESVALLHLVPLVQVGWIDGEISRGEAQKILEAAAIRGITKDTAAYAQLEEWMRRRPPAEFFEKSLRIIREILSALPDQERIDGIHSLVSCCTGIAAASGGLLGFGPRISDTEREALARIARELERDHAAASRHVVEGMRG